MDEITKKRHSLAHLLADSVLKLYPNAKVTIGPAIDNGFYYDILFEDKISDLDLKTIEDQMKKTLPTWDKFEEKIVSADEAREIFKDNKFKLELIDEIEEKGEKITLYQSGDFIDLCRGGHIDSMKDIDPESFKLDKIAGAYWRGDENKEMLTRIYGLAFDSKKELDEYLKKQEEAKERDHRKIGKEMGLFTFSDLIGAGLPLFTPKGTAIRNALKNKLMKISKKYGAEEVTIPHLAKKRLYEISGHAEKFADELLHVESKYDTFVLKPVNCPHHTQIYACQMRSYKDLPLRLVESTMQYRDEKPGEIGGLTRVRAITVDDGHTFCTPDQIKNEAINIAKTIEQFYTEIGLYGNHWVSLSVRDSNNLDAYIGENADWEKAEKMLQEVSDELKLDAKRMEGEAAIYGPKLDFMFKDSLDRERQLATIQIDFAMPKRFGLEYTDQDGSKKTPVMIHRAILGSYERFLSILIEHFAGKFPFWMAPVQVKVLPIAESHLDKAKEVIEALKEKDIRVELDSSNDGFGKKVRKAKEEKVPYFIIIGDKDIEAGKVTLESRDEEDSQQLSLEEVISKFDSLK